MKAREGRIKSRRAGIKWWKQAVRGCGGEGCGKVNFCREWKGGVAKTGSRSGDVL